MVDIISKSMVETINLEMNFNDTFKSITVLGGVICLLVGYKSTLSYLKTRKELETKNKELEIKNKELEIKNKELEIKNKEIEITFKIAQLNNENQLKIAELQNKKS